MFSLSHLHCIDNIIVINGMGQPVMDKVINSKHAEIDFTMLKSGIYLIQLYCNGNVIPLK